MGEAEAVATDTSENVETKSQGISSLSKVLKQNRENKEVTVIPSKKVLKNQHDENGSPIPSQKPSRYKSIIRKDQMVVEEYDEQEAEDENQEEDEEQLEEEEELVEQKVEESSSLDIVEENIPSTSQAPPSEPFQELQKKLLEKVEEETDDQQYTITPEFLEKLYFYSEYGHANNLFKLLALPSHYKYRHEYYQQDLERQKKEEEDANAEILPSPQDASSSRHKVGATIFTSGGKPKRYVTPAKKPWDFISFDDKSLIPVKQGLDVNIPDTNENGWTALHKAVHRSHLDCVMVLSRCQNCNINAQTDLGETPLHFAVKLGNTPIAMYLLKRGAKHDIRDKANDTPFMLAIKFARDSCCKVLIEYGADVADLYDKNLVKIRKLNLTTDEDGANMDGLYFDRYGFQVKNMATYAHPTAVLSNHGHTEEDSERKWKELLTKLVRRGKPDKKLKERIRRGVPFALRPMVWRTFLPIEELKQANYDVYEKCKSQPSTYCKQIDLDINRTFRTHRFFKERYGDGQIKLFNILKAYSVYNPKVGYCQAMSSLVAFFLIYIRNEEDVFWLLVHLLQDPKYRLEEYFAPGLPKVEEAFFIQDELMKKLTPHLYKHFKKEGIEHSMYGVKWYMLLLMDILPFETVSRFYDLMIFEGSKVVYNIVLAILRILEPKLLGMNMEGMMVALRELDKNPHLAADEIIKVATKEKVKQKKLVALSEEFAKSKNKRT